MLILMEWVVIAFDPSHLKGQKPKNVYENVLVYGI